MLIRDRRTARATPLFGIVAVLVVIALSPAKTEAQNPPDRLFSDFPDATSCRGTYSIASRRLTITGPHLRQRAALRVGVFNSGLRRRTIVRIVPWRTLRPIEPGIIRLRLPMSRSGREYLRKQRSPVKVQFAVSNPEGGSGPCTLRRAR